MYELLESAGFGVTTPLSPESLVLIYHGQKSTDFLTVHIEKK